MRQPHPKLKKVHGKRPLFGAALVLGTIFLLSASPGFGASNDRLQIYFSNNQLSVLIEESPLIRVLEKLQITAGVEFAVAEESAHRQITARFHSLPLETALKTILNGFNYSFVYGPDARIQKVSVLRNAPAEVNREAQPTRTNHSVGNDLSFEETMPESRQGDTRIVQKRPSQTAGISSSSDAVMVVSPPSSGNMEIKTMSETMQIDPPQSEDAMQITIPPKPSQ